MGEMDASTLQNHNRQYYKENMDGRHPNHNHNSIHGDFKYSESGQYENDWNYGPHDSHSQDFQYNETFSVNDWLQQNDDLDNQINTKQIDTSSDNPYTRHH